MARSWCQWTATHSDPPGPAVNPHCELPERPNGRHRGRAFREWRQQDRDFSAQAWNFWKQEQRQPKPQEPGRLERNFWKELNSACWMQLSKRKAPMGRPSPKRAPLRWKKERWRTAQPQSPERRGGSAGNTSHRQRREASQPRQVRSKDLFSNRKKSLPQERIHQVTVRRRPRSVAAGARHQPERHTILQNSQRLSDREQLPRMRAIPQRQFRNFEKAARARTAF